MFKCKSCTFWYHPDWKDNKIDPSFERVKYWINEMAEFGVEEIDIGGGEPLIRKDIIDIIKEVKAHGMKCGLTTNGWLVKEKEEIFDYIDYCEVSIDGAKPETNDEIRGVKGAWQKAVDTVRMAKKHNCPVHINFVIQEGNYTEILEYCQLAKDLGVKASFIPISLKLAAQPRLPENLNNYDMKIIRQQLEKAYKTGVVSNNKEFLNMILDKIEKGDRPQKCLAPYRVILVFADSRVFPCGNFDVDMGYLTEDKKFKNMYDSYKNIREEVRDGKHKFCYQCVYADICTKKTIISQAAPFLKKTLKGEQ
jgi:radical SAM protein with 4Fe4S-binding SPASM domain